LTKRNGETIGSTNWERYLFCEFFLLDNSKQIQLGNINWLKRGRFVSPSFLLERRLDLKYFLVIPMVYSSFCYGLEFWNITFFL
jgi:hypothetical protein